MRFKLPFIVPDDLSLHSVKVVLVGLALLAGCANAVAQMPSDSKPNSDKYTLIHAGTLLAEPGRPPLAQRTIVIRNDQVLSIEKGYLSPGEVEVPDEFTADIIDLRERFVLPGLIDSHVHLRYATGAFVIREGFGPRTENRADSTVNAVIAARLTLAAGFTAVRDLGSDDQSVFAVRDAINAGNVLGPTILAAGPSISVTAGHGDKTRTADPDARASAGVCDGVDDCRRLTRHLEKIGADLIKIKITGGFSSQTGLDQHMQPEEMQAIVSAAHQRDMKVTAHGYTPQAIKDAIRAGIDSIEHGFLLDDEGIRMMKAAGTTLVPTLTIARPPAIAMRFIPKGEVPSSIRIRDEAAAFERAYRAGVKIAFGTDCGVYPHGENADEFLTMVEKGMSPMDAIRSATIVAAELLGLKNAGVIAPGKRADIIAVDGDPLADISELGAVEFVMKDGRVAKQNGQVDTAIRYDLEHRY